MRRFRSRPYGGSVRPMRMVSMLLAIAVLWMLFGRFKDPATWRGLLDLKEDRPAEQLSKPASTAAAVDEAVIPGPNDLDPEEFSETQEMFQLVKDRAPLKPREMHAYWRLMEWSRTSSFGELQRRAQRDVPITRLWEQPDQYRGKPISLRLHVRRVLKYDAPENPGRRPFTYEAWGWTDESRSYPYVVVFSECPEGLPVGTDVRAEVEFVDYFLKVMSYTAFDRPLCAPLLVGRVQAPIRLNPSTAATEAPTFLVWVILAAVVVAGFAFWVQFGSGTVIRRRALPAESALNESLLLPGGDPEESAAPDPQLVAIGAEAGSHKP